MKQSWQSQSVEETNKIAREILNKIKVDRTKATVLTLTGDLGSGKTTLTQEIARELGVTDTVISPTFVIAKFYDTTPTQNIFGFKQMIHVDAYRLESSEEIHVLGFKEMLAQPNTLLIIEWPEHVADIIPPHRINLSIVHSRGNNREFIIS